MIIIESIKTYFYIIYNQFHNFCLKIFLTFITFVNILFSSNNLICK